jgi:hypothetical protein
MCIEERKLSMPQPSQMRLVSRSIFEGCHAQKLNWKSVAQKAKVTALKRYLILALTILSMGKVGVASAEPTIGDFGDFQTAAIDGAVGSLAISNGTFHLNNSAENETGTFFAFQPFSGNGQATARIRHSAASQTKVGIVFRQGTNSTSLYAGMFLDGGNTVFERMLTANQSPVRTVRTNETVEWLRIVREGTAFNGFLSKDGTNWIQISADSIEMPNEIFAGFAVSGKGQAVFDKVRMASARLARPMENSSFRAPTNVFFMADVAGHGSRPARVEFFADAEKINEVTNFPYSAVWTNALAGSYSFTARISDASGAEFFTEPANCEVQLPPARVTFVGVDNSTRGNWKGTHGNDGFVIPNEISKPPDYAKINLIRCRPVTWADNVSESRALLKTDSDKRIASTWHSQKPFEIDLNLADGNPHRVALYFLDWDNAGRAELVELLDVQTKGVLDSRSVAGFSNGTYLIWSCTGHIKIRISPKISNTSASGLFFNPEPETK